MLLTFLLCSIDSTVQLQRRWCVRILDRCGCNQRARCECHHGHSSLWPLACQRWLRLRDSQQQRGVCGRVRLRIRPAHAGAALLLRTRHFASCCNLSDVSPPLAHPGLHWSSRVFLRAAWWQLHHICFAFHYFNNWRHNNNSNGIESLPPRYIGGYRPLVLHHQSSR